MALDLTDKSTLVQVMAWCHQATSHYLSQCWPKFMLPYGVTRPQWVNMHLKIMFPINQLQLSDAIDLDQHWIRYWLATCLVPSQYPNQCWLIISWIVRNKLQSTFNQNTVNLIQENEFLNVFCKMKAILSQSWCFNSLRLSDAYMRRLSNHHWFR